MSYILNISMTLMFAVVMGVGQIVLSYASKEIFSQELLTFKVVFGSGWLWLGVLIYAFSMIFWVYILSRFDVKYAYPISSTAIFFAAIFQSIIQKTIPSNNYWIGLLFVVAGLVILSLDSRN